jgi:hypothetical protein
MGKKIPSAILIISGVFIGRSAFSEYFFQITASFLLLIFLFYLFWEENTPPVIIAGIGFQWLSVAIGHIYLILTDQKYEILLWHPESSLEKIETTYWLSIFGILFFALGIKSAIRNLRPLKLSINLIEKYDTFKIIILYASFSAFVSSLFGLLRFAAPGISQPVGMLLYLKWSLLYIMIYNSYKKNEHKNIVLAIIIIEIILGFTGFFSVFKDILILLPIIYLTFNKIRGIKQIGFLILMAAILINIGAVWSYVKVGYREFLSGGKREQIVTVSKQEALSKLIDLTSQINAKSYQIGMEALVKRIYFLEYFSASVKYIPARHPYFNGENWGNALKHVVMPRMIFPEKEAIDDSKQTTKLSGIIVADSSQGTSISIGYMAESYADFGIPFLFIPVFLLGLLMGLIYKFLMQSYQNPLWNYALVMPMYFLIDVFGDNIIKIMGNTVMFLLVFVIFVKFVLPYADSFIRKK